MATPPPLCRRELSSEAWVCMYTYALFIVVLFISWLCWPMLLYFLKRNKSSIFKRCPVCLSVGLSVTLSRLNCCIEFDKKLTWNYFDFWWRSFVHLHSFINFHIKMKKKVTIVNLLQIFFKHPITHILIKNIYYWRENILLACL